MSSENLKSKTQLINELHTAVVGNEVMGHEGLVKKVERHEHWIKSADTKLAMAVGGGIVIVFLIELIFKK